MHKTHRIFAVFLVLVLGNGLAAGGLAGAQDSSETLPTQTTYPVSIEQCGRTLTFEKAPTRVLATYQNVAEILVALGLTDKIVGVTYGQSYPAPAGYEAEVDGLNWMVEASQPQAGREAVLSLTPDFVFVAYPQYDLDESAGFATQADFENAGAAVFPITDQCLADASQSTIETVYADILDLGVIFDVQGRAQELVSSMRARIEAVQHSIESLEEVDVAFIDFASATEMPSPLPVYGAGLNADMIRLAGGHNVFGDGTEVYFEVSIEEIAVLQVEIIALLDTSPPYYEDVDLRAELFFTTFPEIPASGERRYVAVNGASFAAGIRIPEAVETMARAFHPDAFDGATPAASS